MIQRIGLAGQVFCACACGLARASAAAAPSAVWSRERRDKATGTVTKTPFGKFNNGRALPGAISAGTIRNLCAVIVTPAHPA